MKNYRLDIKLNLDDYYEELLYNFLCNHSKQEIKNILLIEALYEEKTICIPKKIKGEIKK